MSALSPESLGVAQAIVQNFFPALQADRSNLVSFFGDDSSIFFQGETATGKEQIDNFLKFKIPKMSINVTGFEVQTVPQSNLWSMVIVIGTTRIGNDRAKTFHASVYVNARTTDHTAFIQYLSFTSFD